MTDQASFPAPGRVLSVNVGQVREVEWLGQRSTTAIWKYPVDGRVPVVGVNLAGDDQADRRAHGGRDKAVYSYSREDEEWWEQQLGRAVELGNFGENLTLQGVDVTGAVIGERWQVGSNVLEVAQPRIPCWKLGARMGDPDFPPKFGAAGRPGAYLRIITEGEIGAGDEVHVLYRPGHGITVGDAAHIYHSDNAQASLLLEIEELAEPLKNWARRILRHTKR
ncbi:MAG: MOSC domain-containing protein [Chloroflexota bacterium]|nr:MOSC domain-containing protein [Chloroflexota bacterium]MDQ5864318.1 MOSC domain-containing protein [Chloroflexota bacterium]